MHGGRERCLQAFDWEARRPRHRWEDNIKMNLTETGIGWFRIGSSGRLL
jgi:hypothetical protein